VTQPREAAPVDDDAMGGRGHLPIDPDLGVEDPAGPTVQPPRPHPATHQRRAHPAALAAIALGGMVGSTARYALGRWVPPSPGRLPWATLLANLGGSLALGFVLVLLLTRHPHRHRLRAFATTGVLGAFTTMSTFAVEAALLVGDGHALTGLAYVVASVGGGLAAVAVGMAGARALVTGASA
jgi:CrcB protein